MLTFDRLYDRSKRASSLIVDLVYPEVVQKRRNIIADLVRRYGWPNARIIDLGAGHGSFSVEDLPWPVRLVSVDRAILAGTTLIGDVQHVPLRDGIADI